MVEKKLLQLVFATFLAVWAALAFSNSAIADTLLPGDLDPSFGSAGSIRYRDPVPRGTRSSAILVRRDGTLLVGDGVPSLLDASGAPDPGYRWMDGRDDLYRRCVSLGGGCDVHGTALTDDDKLILGLALRSADGSFRFGAARIASDGALDTTFGSGGVALSDAITNGNVASSVTVLPDGEILIAGSTFPPLVGNCLAFARFTPDGRVDRAFGSGGIVVTTIDGLPTALLPQPDGRVVVVAVVDAGPAAPLAVPKILVVRLMQSGDIDRSFGDDGQFAEDFGGGSAWPSGAALQPNGSIVITARHGLEGSPGGIRQFSLLRLLSDGSADNGFGDTGKVTVKVGEDDSDSQAEGVALQADGKIVVVGTVIQNSIYPLGFRRVAVARFNQDGTLDPLFAPGGVTLAWSGFGADGYGVGIQPGGRIVVAGMAEGPPVLQFGYDIGGAFSYWSQTTTPALYGFVGGDAAYSRLTRQAKAVEYYHAGFGHYFITANAYEIAVLDTDPRFTADWVRTGLEFRVASEMAEGLSPVCRFFSGQTFAPRSSHFYTPYAAECDLLKSGSVWSYEGTAFYLGFANDRALCAPPNEALYRLYNNGQGGSPNHRYTTDPAAALQMIGEGWLVEGDVRTGVFACVPM